MKFIDVNLLCVPFFEVNAIAVNKRCLRDGLITFKMHSIKRTHSPHITGLWKFVYENI